MIEFEGTRGLPSTADRDKYMAFMKIADEQRERMGQICNPIRFTGSRLLQELGLSDSGENYEDINAWGERMAKTTITSRQVIYLAQAKRYANKTIHVFESFQRVGKDSGSKRTEEYEIVLSDWLLENLNSEYVIHENFSAYKQLKRPTAKGIFAFLHWWFGSNDCRPFEKNYQELCALLGIQAYTYLSEIKRTIGKALDELKALRYISRWDIQPMASSEGYKIILWPGEDLKKSMLQASRRFPAPRFASGDKLALPEDTAAEKENSDLTMENQQALLAMTALGVAARTAQSLIKKHDATLILDTAEYVSSLVQRDSNRRIYNPAGMLIYWLESGMTIPAGFITSREKETANNHRQQHEMQVQMEANIRIAYMTWADEQVEHELLTRYPGELLEQKIREVVSQRVKTDAKIRRLSDHQRVCVGRVILLKEIRDELPLPSMEQWAKTNSQQLLFEA